MFGLEMVSRQKRDERSMTHTQGKEASEEDSQEQQKKANPELTAFIHGREEGTASSSLPDLMQRRIHRLIWEGK